MTITELPFTGPEGVAGLLWSVAALFGLGSLGLIAARREGRHE